MPISKDRSHVHATAPSDLLSSSQELLLHQDCLCRPLDRYYLVLTTPHICIAVPQNNKADAYKWIVLPEFVVALFNWFRVLFLSTQTHTRLRAYGDVVFLIAIETSDDRHYFRISSPFLFSTVASYLMVRHSICLFSNCPRSSSIPRRRLSFSDSPKQSSP